MKGVGGMSDRVIYGLRVFDASGGFVCVSGADRDAVIAQDDDVYGRWPSPYVIERLTASVGDYVSWEAAPDVGASAQVWAEFIWTPGG